MAKNEDFQKKSPFECIKSLKDISLIKVKAEEKKKIDSKKRYHSKSPIKPHKQEIVQTELDNNFDASDISDIEKLILKEKKRNKSARKSIHRVANELNDYYVTNDLISSPKKQNPITFTSGYTTDFYIQYSQELEKQYADMEKNNEELEKKLLEYSDLESNYNKLKIELLEYNQYKSIASEFTKKEEKDKNLSPYHSNKDVLYNLYGSNKMINNNNKNSFDLIKKNNEYNSKFDSILEYDSANIFRCDNSKCLEYTKLYDELRKLTLRLKCENEGWKRKCLELGGDLLTIKELQTVKPKSILDK